MIQDMTTSCPAGWHDKSMLILSSSRAGASGVMPNIVITQEKISSDKNSDPKLRMDDFVEQQTVRMRAQLAGFVELSRLVANSRHPTVELKINWHSAQAALTQMVTFIDLGDNIFAIATATAGRGDFEDVELVFRKIIQDFRIRR